MIFPAEKKLLYLITAGELPGTDAERRLLDIVMLAVELEISLIQLREKSLSTRELCRLAANLVSVTNGTSTRLLINDRADVASAVGADGVHLTTRSLTAKAVRASFPHLLIGVSTHNETDLAEAVNEQADFAVFGPVFESPGKGEPAGLEELRRMCGIFRGFPILGLGGIGEDDIEDVFATGAAGVAAIRLLNDRSILAKIGLDA